MSSKRDTGSIFFSEARSLWIGAIYLPNGKRKQVTSKDKDACIAKLDAVKRNIADGLDPHSDQVTVATWCQHWLKELAPRSVRPNTLANYRSDVNNYISPTIGKVKLQDLKPHHVREVVTAVTESGRSTGTALNVYRTLSIALGSAVNEEMLLRNPCERVKPPKVTRNERGALSVEQAQTLLSTAIESDDPMATRWAAALMLGARQGELLGLQWDRVDLAKRTVDLEYALDRLPQKHGCGGTCGAKRVSGCPKVQFDVESWFEYIPLYKNLALVDPKSERSRRVVPIPEPLAVMLEEYRESAVPNRHGLVWATPGGEPIDPGADLRAWKAAVKRAGLPPAVLHEARHSTASLLLQSGVQAEVITKILGHSSILVSLGYAHSSVDLARSALSNLDVLLE
ncbi:site-specific integrase [Rhodococcus qingshengii]|uniref:tyrosine-type recombinase/integrase n=1 Tax=Rhodococcus TaxID=1827 RepID=UPI001E35B789|nr:MULTISPECIES: site-specific integrase [Rhodococcus]MCD2099628.1 site-specific integrase [Rhodococcus rhodochrous]MCD2123996.1 site-specific integrase [Rhodococcus rhodochrous]MCQ4136571.1 site-specific integrase [Rhodococcus rhodochrous]MDJ0490643.1 site-specific integrase [Rhodococcus qingshengii]